MSVELDFYLTVTRIPRGREDAVAAATAKVLAREGLSDLHGPHAIDEGLAWTSDPSEPMIISASYRWIPKVEAAIAAAVRRASGGKAKPTMTWIYRELRSRYKDTLRTMKQLVARSAALDACWRELARGFGSLEPIGERDGIRFGLGTVKLRKERVPAIVTCGLSLAKGVELYVVPATRADTRFAELFLAAVATDVRIGPRIRSSELAERIMFSLGKIDGHGVDAIADPDIPLPRKAGRVPLLPVMSVTRVLGGRRVDGIPFRNADDLGAVYRWFGRVRDPKHADASQLVNASRSPRASAKP